MILRNFLPIEKLTIIAENFRNSKILPSILMQNHATLKIWDNDLSPIITLNDLLLNNSKAITVENFHQPQKQLNKFIKLWQRGSNPYLEYLRIDYLNGEEHDKEIVMKGIKHETNLRTRVRHFKPAGSNSWIPVCGGMDVYRMDGVKATIQFFNGEVVEMFIWFDN
ncbi:hypothetical protein CAEBREN_07700 [Caenorhabditis brenneri]|uniref:Sdz-33 F-box domain-containing protein n=1 Tax=Caenorhabditis brenneri TaxID=135651 RepID=G0N0D3_CAEBE|nr:hypothetical protein CAEBREN_07700 [Caenorhabditis brenneri]